MSASRSPAIGLAEWRLPRSGEAALRLAARAGADGVQVEFGGGSRGEWADAPGRISALREAAAATGVKLLAVAGNVLNDLGLPAPPGGPEEARVRRVLVRLLDAAIGLGVPLAFVPSFRRGAIDGPVAFDRTARMLAWAATEAEARGVVLANENVLPPAGARALVEAVASPAFRLVLDTFNPVDAGLDPVRLVAEVAGAFAGQVHLKDGPPAVGDMPPLGAGSGRLDATLSAVSRHMRGVEALVLENDYRDGRAGRIAADLAWARSAALRHGL
ncbi:sugar phosphate isomerase/epimerase family protein [Nonomuraea sp. NPDC050790]|uniref:sugar phosphate isomerase/epimerase family protein n=1 Tax=Nonomuraea sp. NPDC050790 TaxID=3364371 RepID=UPI00378913E0